jgi:hypothetical protein
MDFPIMLKKTKLITLDIQIVELASGYFAIDFLRRNSAEILFKTLAIKFLKIKSILHSFC